MAKQVMPPARLDARPSDVKFTEELLLKISLFAQLKRKPSLDKFPGSLVLRHFKKGETICRQGEAGWTAFYILTTEDVFEMFRALLQTTEPGAERQAYQRQAQDQVTRLAWLKDQPDNPELRKLATVHLMMARPAPPTRTESFWSRLIRRSATRPSSSEPSPVSIPIDAPTDVDFETLKAPLHEGELFGEMSCRIGAPRSATIIADRECFMLEMLRNIYDQLQKDAAYKARTDEMYKQRRLQSLRKLSIFAELSDAQFVMIRDRIDLLTFDPGQIIYDENDRSDSLYIIQRGMVRVLKKASVLLGLEHVRDWKTLTAALVAAEKEAGTGKQGVWNQLNDAAKAACRMGGQASLRDEDQHHVLQALNEIIKNPKLPTVAEFAKIGKNPAFQEKLEHFPASQKDWSEQDKRRYNRLLLDAALDGLIRAHRRRVGPDCVLYYCAGGDFIGELCVTGQTIRSETCVTQGHPEDAGTSKDAGPVEVVRIPVEVLRGLVKETPALKSRLERKIAERRKRTQEQVKVPVWDESHEVLTSEKFQQLGLIQGQKLMLIDLDRCTRCDECVRACVDTHEDGQSRLFLSGPRFGRFLVPMSCRSCLDPVCMVGCPVGSIHRGDNGQMVIEDWCIGCGLCAQNCPYESIRMNDIAVLPEDAPDWRYLPLSAVNAEKWMQPRCRDRRWLAGRGPFINDRVFREGLRPYLKIKDPVESIQNVTGRMVTRDLTALAVLTAGAGATQIGEPLCFRFHFQLTKEQMRDDRWFKMTITSKDPDLAAWVNGREVTPDEQGSGGKREYSLPQRPAARKHTTQAGTGKAAEKVKQSEMEKEVTATSAPKPVPGNPLRVGSNVLAIQVSPDVCVGEQFLSVRLDEVRKPSVGGDADVTQKQVTERAVVCDLCSSQWGQRPACVNACPHDAAIRIDARSDFPMR
jgi:Fe-S-cluster-containing hydrogenase component 2